MTDPRVLVHRAAPLLLLAWSGCSDDDGLEVICAADSTSIGLDDASATGFSGDDVVAALTRVDYEYDASEAGQENPGPIPGAGLDDSGPIRIAIAAQGDEATLIELTPGPQGPQCDVSTFPRIHVALAVQIGSADATLDVSGGGGVETWTVDADQLWFGATLTGTVPTALLDGAAALQADRCESPTGSPDVSAFVEGFMTTPTMSFESEYNESGNCSYQATLATVSLVPREQSP
jgi:hypothetical protein